MSCLWLHALACCRPVRLVEAIRPSYLRQSCNKLAGNVQVSDFIVLSGHLFAGGKL